MTKLIGEIYTRYLDENFDEIYKKDLKFTGLLMIRFYFLSIVFFKFNLSIQVSTNGKGFCLIFFIK